jgi:hypothetical protein
LSLTYCNCLCVFSSVRPPIRPSVHHSTHFAQLSILIKKVEKLKKKDAKEIAMEIEEAKKVDNIEKLLLREGEIARER